MKKNILEYLEKYGVVEKLETKEEKKIELYMYRVKACVIYPEDERFKKFETPTGFLISCNTETDEVGIYCFNLGNKSSFQSDIYETVNKVNKRMKYGRMYVDEDGDIGWVIVFEQAGTTADEIWSYLRSFFEGIRDLADER